MIVRELVTLLGFKVDDAALDRYERRMNQVKRGVALAGIAIGALGGYFLKTAGEMEQTNIAFETILGSTQKANKLLGDLAKFAAKTPFERTELIQYSQAMLGVGWTAEDIIPQLTMMGNIAAGIGKEKLPNMMIAFNKMRAKGKASLEELWPIVEAGVPIMDQLVIMLGKSKAEIMKLASSDTGIAFNTVLEGLQKVEKAKFANLMIKQSKSLLGIFSNIIDYLKIMAGEIGMAMLPMVKELALEFIEFFEANKDLIKAGAVEFFRALMYAIGYTIVAVEMIVEEFGGFRNIVLKTSAAIRLVWGLLSKTVKLLWDYRVAITALGASILVYNTIQKAMAIYSTISFWIQLIGLAKNLQEVFVVLNLTMLANPMFWVVAGIIALIAAGYLLWKHWDKVSKWLRENFKLIAWALTPIIGLPALLIANWDIVGPFFKRLWAAIVKTFMDNVKIIKTIWGWLVGAFDKVTSFLGLKPELKATINRGSLGPSRRSTPVPPGVGGKRTAGTTNIINSNPTIAVPAGTSNEQTAYLKRATKQLVQEEWQSLLQQTNAANPVA